MHRSLSWNGIATGGRQGVAIPFLVLLLLTAAASRACPQATVGVTATGTPDDPKLSEVIREAAGLELRNENLRLSARSTAALGGETNPGSISENVTRDMDFLLVVGYVEKQGEITASLSFVDVKDGQTIGRTQARLPLDLNLDSGVAQTVESLTSQEAVKKAISEAARAKPTSGSEKEVAAAPGGGKLTGEASSGVSTAHPSSGGTPSSPSQQIAEGRWRFAWSASGAPMFVLGGASSYFQYGANVSTFLGVGFPTRAISLSAGVHVGASQLFLTAGPGQGNVYTVPVGLEARIGSPEDLPVGVSARVSGGAAALVVQPSSGTLEAKTDLFVGGGVGAQVKVWKLFVGIKMDAIVVFEGVYPIVAIEPGLIVRM